ncbi:MAG TPA: CPBP family intramembrane glutamic endopeptidase [Candidatus Polarisedimenticolia bacterium]|nr:CPBP family intramembrane glutamic endopeptidase [Candidatus Polarisedimenticolia bacterium]
MVGAVGLVARRADLSPADTPALALSLVALALLLLPLPALLSGRGIAFVKSLVDDRPGRLMVLPAVLLLPCLLYWSVPGHVTPAGALRLVSYVVVPTALAIGLPLGRARAAGDALVVLSLWIPVEMRLLKPCFPWPAGGAGAILAGVVGLDLLLYLMLIVRGFDSTGLVLRLGGRDLLVATVAFVSFCAVGIPIGVLSGFLSFGVRGGGLPVMLAAAVMILIFTGLPEEVLFRGFIQSLVERTTGRPYAALLIASVIFGAAHLDNGPAPDWRYGLLATLAGMAYGWVYMRTRRILAPASTHALVDVTRAFFFKG